MPGLIENVRRISEQLTTRQKVQIFVAVIALVGTIWGVAEYTTRIRYGLLFGHLDAEDATNVVAKLKELDVPHRVSRGGRVIEVPAGRVDELRMELAGDGLPRGGGIGFEIFDKPSFGLSDFVQNVNYRRALEHELARSIQSLDSVQSARVHLALPAESVFADEKREASASVVLRLRGDRLQSDRVGAIAHLVASGVDGLESSRVSVVDGHGRMLTDGEGEDGDTVLSATQVEVKRAMENRVESVLVAILEPVVGTGRVRARATVELNTARVERVQETFDPDGAVVRSEQKGRTRNRGSASGGVPGTASNLPGETAPGAASGAAQDSQTSTTNFEINKTVSTFAEPRGTLSRQSVAVVVDNATQVIGDGQEDAATQSAPRTEQEMKQITDLVRAAVGIDESRGDVLIVENIPFDETIAPGELAVDGGIDWFGMIVRIARYAALPIAVLLIALLVIRPGIAALRSVRQESALSGGPMTVAELQARLARASLGSPGGASGFRQKLIEATAEDPESAAVVVRGWLGKQSGD